MGTLPGAGDNAIAPFFCIISLLFPRLISIAIDSKVKGFFTKKISLNQMAIPFFTLF
jgi:hypothetical protein